MAEDAAEEKKAWFNPSWHAFLLHVKARSELFLEAVLRRVSPKSFILGKIVLEAGSFDLKSLSENDMRRSLQSCLFSYSGTEHWEISLVKHEAGEKSDSSPEQRDIGRESKITAAAVPGSVSALESLERRERRTQIEQQARNDPSVVAVLGVFQDSKIERISIIDERAAAAGKKTAEIGSGGKLSKI